MLPLHQQGSFALNHGDSAVVDVGATIGWGSFECSTQLAIIPDLDGLQEQTMAAKPNMPIFLPGANVSTNDSVMDIDPSVHGIPYNHLSRARGVPLTSPGVKPLAAGEISATPVSSDRNPLKEQLHIAPPMDAYQRMQPDSQPLRVKQDPSSPPKIIIPLPAPTLPREAVPTKQILPHLYHEHPPTATMTSPRQTAAAPAHFFPGPTPLDRVYSASPALQQLQHKHALELEALLSKQQLDLAALVTAQRLECDALLRGAPLIPVSNSVNLGILGVFSKLQSLVQLQPHHGGRSALTNSDEIDILSVDEPSSDASAWKSAMAPQTQVKSTKKSSKRKDAASASPASGATPSPSAHVQHAHQPHHHHQKNAESSSEDDSRRTHRKRQRKVEPDYYVDDREMDQILGGAKKKRAEAMAQQGVGNGSNSMDVFPVPVAVNAGLPMSSSPSVAAVAMPYKKPKPRDNVAIATILDIYAPQKSLLPSWKHTCGAKTLILFHTDCLDHVTPDWHLESPNRLRAVMDAIELVSSRYGGFCEVVSDFKPADLDLVRACHEEAYIKKIMNKIPLNRAMPPLHATQDIELSLSMSASLAKPAADPACEPPKDTFVSFGSWNAALLAAGSVIEAIDRLMTQAVPSDVTVAMDATSPENHTLRNVFCGVRPPGHHAGSHGHDGASTNGYCVLNSVAIGAQHAFRKYGFTRIAILDFDVHQGNGTAQIVEKDERILFISLHASEIYPFTESTKAEADKCTNRVINIGYPTGTTGKQFMELFVTRCRQVIADFDPELILLSSGFDAHVDDPTGAAQLRFADYVALTRTVKELADTPACKGRIVSVLEGGYDIRALKLSVTAHLLTLMEGQPAPITKDNFYGNGTYKPLPPKIATPIISASTDTITNSSQHSSASSTQVSPLSTVKQEENGDAHSTRTSNPQIAPNTTTPTNTTISLTSTSNSDGTTSTAESPTHNNSMAVDPTQQSTF